MTIVDDVTTLIMEKRVLAPTRRALLVAISGIDGAGKGYLTKKVVNVLVQNHMRVASINIDDWLNLPNQRFSKKQPAEHFYENGIRFREMFEQLVLHLKKKRSHSVEAELADATNKDEYHKYVYQFDDIDIIILEGIFLLKQALREYYDLKFWVDSTFETALERSLKRNQEGLSAEAMIRDYNTIYFVAKRIHFAVLFHNIFCTFLYEPPSSGSYLNLAL